MMKIYSLISQKGGTGKSTLARQFAVLVGPSVLIDRDPQQTTRKWWERRQQVEPAPEQPELLDINGSQLTEAAHVLRQREGGSVFIDTRPAVDGPEAEAAQVSDVVLIPVRPSPDDLEAVVETLRIVRRLERPAVLIVNAAKTSSRAIAARAALSRYPVPVCPYHVADRTVYLDASLEGRGVGEMRGAVAAEAAAELQRVWNWVQEIAGEC